LLRVSSSRAFIGHEVRQNKESERSFRFRETKKYSSFLILRRFCAKPPQYAAANGSTFAHAALEPVFTFGFAPQRFIDCSNR